MNLVYRVVAAELLEVRDLVDILAGEDRRRASLCNLLEKIGVDPGNHVFHPLQVELLVGFGQLDHRLHSDVSQMINRERYFITDRGSDCADKFAHPVYAFVGDLGCDKGMRRSEEHTSEPQSRQY